MPPVKINIMSDTNNYVPVLKWKSAERNALKFVKNKTMIRPLIELVMPKYKGGKPLVRENLEEITQWQIMEFRKKIDEIPQQVKDTWGDGQILIDFSLIENEIKIESVDKISNLASKLGLRFVPVFNLSDPDDFKSAVCERNLDYFDGICLRIVKQDLKDIDQCNRNIESIVQTFKLKRDNMDLLVDMKETAETDIEYLKKSQSIKKLTEWRGYIFCSGAFPQDLSECKVGETNLVARMDWLNWKEVNDLGLERVPTFSDYSIRHPIYNRYAENFGASSSIKYTLNDDWLILRGTKGNPAQFLGHAKSLVDNDFFWGEQHSYGDEIILEKANYLSEYIEKKKLGKDPKGTGNSTTWIQVGINHHIEFVLYQIANLT